MGLGLNLGLGFPDRHVFTPHVFLVFYLYKFFVCKLSACFLPFLYKGLLPLGRKVIWGKRMGLDTKGLEPTKVRTWFRGGDFIQLLNSFKRGLNNKKRKLYYALALTQLLNGSRVSETIDTLEQFCINNKSEVEVRIRKHKNSDYRLVIIPKDIVQYKDIVCSELAVWLAKPNYKQILKRSFTMWLRYHYRINSHTLRYLFITYNAHLPMQVLAKIVGHKKLDYLITYTTKLKAYDVLRGLVNAL